MTKAIIFTLLVALGSARVLSQTDTLNQRNSSGEKTGWWITYLDVNLKVLDDSIGATHCMYNYYTGNFYHYRYGNGLGSKKYPVIYPEFDTLKIKNFTLLNGDYLTKYNNGQIRSILSTSNGMLTEYKEYYPDGKLHLQYLYGKECDAPIHNCLKEYDKEGNLTYDGLNWVPKESETHSNYRPVNSDTTFTQSGILDGNKYLIQVTQTSGKKDEWPSDTLAFSSGRVYSSYMSKRENFKSANYVTKADSVFNFKYENENPYGSLLIISGTVQGNVVKGTITWTDGNNKVNTRTYNFEGYLINQ